MDFSLAKRLAITKAIIELTDPLGSSNLFESKSGRNSKFENNFYENDRIDVRSHHKRPLYVTAKVRDLESKKAMLDQVSSLNIISLSVLDAIGVSTQLKCQDLEVVEHIQWDYKHWPDSMIDSRCSSIPCHWRLDFLMLVAWTNLDLLL